MNWASASAPPPHCWQFSEGLRFSFDCSLLGPRGGPPPSGAAPGSACEAATPMYAALAITSYGVFLVGFALVARDGGVFGTIVQVRPRRDNAGGRMGQES